VIECKPLPAVRSHVIKRKRAARSAKMPPATRKTLPATQIRYEQRKHIARYSIAPEIGEKTKKRHPGAEPSAMPGNLSDSCKMRALVSSGIFKMPESWISPPPRFRCAAGGLAHERVRPRYFLVYPQDGRKKRREEESIASCNPLRRVGLCGKNLKVLAFGVRLINRAAGT